tara:strand:+ start:157 stop:306 length:150 start_codon:yes stop_codon:yes gene_type:complete
VQKYLKITLQHKEMKNSKSKYPPIKIAKYFPQDILTILFAELIPLSQEV